MSLSKRGTHSVKLKCGSDDSVQKGHTFEEQALIPSRRGTHSVCDGGEDLPDTFKKTGILPSGTNLEPSKISAVQRYLIMVNHHADEFNACSRLALPPPQPNIITNDMYDQAISRVRSLAIPPVPKQPQIYDPQRSRTDPPSAWQIFQQRPRPNYPIDEGVLDVYFDSSFTPLSDELSAQAGYGVTAVWLGGAADCCGAVELTRTADTWVGAETFTNNTAELSAATLALQFVATTNLLRPTVARIYYDSTYAFGATTGIFRARANHRLVAFARRALNDACVRCRVTWHHIDSHTGNYHNDRADALAELGAWGISKHWPTQSTRPPGLV